MIEEQAVLLKLIEQLSEGLAQKSELLELLPGTEFEDDIRRIKGGKSSRKTIPETRFQTACHFTTPRNLLIKYE